MTIEVKLLNINAHCDGIKKPSKPHITDEQEMVTEEEIKNRMRAAEELEGLGISTSKFDIESGYEDSDELQAIILVKQGKKLPEDLKKRLMDKKQRNSEKKKVKH